MMLTQDGRGIVGDKRDSVWPQSSVSVSVGSLGPGAHKVLFVPSKSLFAQSCVSSGSFMVGLMVTSSKRAYAIPKSASSRDTVPGAVHC